jgi:hypothetical protein
MTVYHLNKSVSVILRSGSRKEVVHDSRGCKRGLRFGTPRCSVCNAGSRDGDPAMTVQSLKQINRSLPARRIVKKVVHNFQEPLGAILIREVSSAR